MTSSTPWFGTASFRRNALCLLAIVTLIEGYFAICRRDNDFVCHRQVGAAFLAGDPYGNGNEIYPVGRAMMNSLLALGPYRPTRVVCFVLALAALVACYRMWKQLAPEIGAHHPQLGFAAAFFTCLLFLPYVVRDLDECGLQIYTLFFLTAGGFALWHGRRAQSGFWLATAATYKVAPLLFLPFLLWKRQWAAATWTVVFLLVWALAPALYLGAEMTWSSHQKFFACASKVSSAESAYPYQPGREVPKIQNVSLQAAVARVLETYPPGHPLHLEHPAFVQFLDLEPETAYRGARLLLLGFGLVLAWRLRRAWQGDVDNFATEWAAVCLLSAILSPICWQQHLVLILPCAFLVVRSFLGGERLGPWRWCGLAVIAFLVLCTKRELMGASLAMVLHSYKVDTLAMLVLLGLGLTLPKRTASQVEDVPRLEGSLPRAA